MPKPLSLAIVPVLLACTAPLTAQLPTDAALLLEDVPLTEPGYRLVDVFGRGATQVRDQNVFMPVAGIALDPDAPQFFYFLGAASSLPGTWRTELTELASIDTSIWGPWTQQPASRIAVQGVRIATIAGTTLELKPKAGNQPSQILTVPDSLDVALLDDRAYLAASNGDAVEVDLLGGTTRIVGTFAGLITIAVSPLGNELCIGTSTGEVRRVDIATGATTAQLASSLAPIRAVAFTRFATAVWSDGTALWSELAGPGPIYHSPTTILDLDVAQATGASIVPFGDGCGVGSSVAWSVPGAPALGAANFALGANGLPGSSLALLAAGSSRTLWSATGAPLPFDLAPLGAAGCSLLVDPQVTVALATSPSGSAATALPIPNNPALIGAELVAQWLVPDATIVPLRLAVSEAVAFVIG
ncbi:MAG: hypothetical protein R3F29_08295 [Planctomycetota bacterium]